MEKNNIKNAIQQAKNKINLLDFLNRPIICLQIIQKQWIKSNKLLKQKESCRNYLMNKEQLIAFEEEIASLFTLGKIKARIHLYQGNEENIIKI